MQIPSEQEKKPITEKAVGFTSPMLEAVERLQPIHKRMLDGKITEAEYRIELEAELAKL